MTRALGQVLATLLAATLGASCVPVVAQGLRAPPGVSGAPTLNTSPPSASTPANRLNLGQRAADYVIAMVNTEPVTNSEVRERALRVGQQLALQGAERPAPVDLLQMALEILIAEKLQMQAASLANIKVDAATIAQAEQNVAAQNRLTLDEVLKRLQEDGITRDMFRQTLRVQLTMNKLREREVDSRVKVTDGEVDQFVAEQRNAPATTNLMLNIAQVLVAVPESATEAQRASLQARAQRVFERARSGEDFAALAREFSDGPEASAGGQLGLRLAERYPELFLDAVKALAIGAIAGPVRSGAGLHVLKVIERGQSGGIPDAMTQSRARHILLRPGPQLSEAQAVERIEGMRRSIAAGQGEFAALAKQHSHDGSAREGGELGWTNPGQFVPEFEDALNALEPGQLSTPVVTRFGIHLIQLLERREIPLGDRERRAIARNLVRRKKTEEAYNTWLQDLRGGAYVQIREAPQ